MAYDQETAREYLAEWIKPSTVVFTLTTPGRGETDYVRVFVASKRNSIADVTYLVAPAIGRKLRNRYDHSIPMGGGGYNKALDVYLDIRYALKHQKPGSVDGQSKLREL